MHEPTVTRTLGASGTQPAWPEVAAWPDVTRTHRPDVPAATRPAPQAGDGHAEATQVDTAGPRDASFPRSYAQFEINKETQRLSIKIVDAATHEVIRVIPSEEVQRISFELQAMARRDTIGQRQPGSVGGGSEPTASGGVDRYV